MNSSVMINQIHDVSSINEMNTTELYSASITTYMKNEIVYEIHENEEYLSCLNNEEEISKMQQHSMSDSTEIKYFSNILGNELTVFEATDDESMAVEALRQLGSMYSGNTVLSPEQNVKNYDTHKFNNKTPSACKKPSTFTCSYCNALFDTESAYNNHSPCHQKFVCKFCAQSFVALTELRAHTAENHPGDRPYKCHVCLQNFPRPSSLTNHLKIHNYQPGRALLVSKQQQQQQQQQVSSNNLVAAVTKQPVNNAPAFLKFENIDTVQPWPVEQVYVADATVSNTTVTNNDPLATSWQFTTTNYDSTNNGELVVSDAIDTHQFNNSNPDGSEVKVELVLPYDNKHEAFPISSMPQMEITVKSDVVETKPYTCMQCGLAFSREKALITHRKIHNSGVSYACDVCGAGFDNETLKLQHRQRCLVDAAAAAAAADDDDPLYGVKQVQEEENSEEKKSSLKLKHPCPDCEKRFTTKQKMYRHMWIHRKKSFACEHCARTFALQPELDKHRLSVHPADSPYVCQECGKSFASRQGLWEHGRLHGSGPTGTAFTCARCRKSFASRQGYLIHNRIHTGERPYGCRYCLKAFRDGGTLRKHERIHTGERPHVCPICQHDFNQKVVLREHVRWVHAASAIANSEASFTCQLCDATVSDREELCAHIVRHSDLTRHSNTTTRTVVSAHHHRTAKTKKLTVKQKSNTSVTHKSTEQQTSSNECDLCGTKFASHEDLMTHVHIHI